MKLTSIMKYSLYNVIKRRPSNLADKYLPLYKSRVFNGLDLSDNLSKSQPAQRYKEFLPFMIMETSDIFKPKVLVTQLHFNPETETLKVVSLRARGIISQQFNINNIIPITYADMRAYNRIPEPLLPVYIDDTMTYLNKFNDETYIFEFDGSWNEETVNHPQLSTQVRLNEKEWFDRRTVY